MSVNWRGRERIQRIMWENEQEERNNNVRARELRHKHTQHSDQHNSHSTHNTLTHNTTHSLLSLSLSLSMITWLQAQIFQRSFPWWAGRREVWSWRIRIGRSCCHHSVAEWEDEREREREETHTGKKADKHNRQTDTDRQTHKQKTHTQTHTDGQTDKQTNRQTHRQRDREGLQLERSESTYRRRCAAFKTDRQKTVKQTQRPDRQKQTVHTTKTQTDRQTDKQTETDRQTNRERESLQGQSSESRYRERRHRKCGAAFALFLSAPPNEDSDLCDNNQWDKRDIRNGRHTNINRRADRHTMR